MKRFVLLAVTAIAVVASPPAHAEGSKLKVYGMLAYVSPLAQTDQNINGVTDAVKASDEFGYSFGLEFRANPLLGVELDYLYAKHDVTHHTAGLLGETAFQPISGTLNLHFPLGNLDVYGGPTVAYVNWGDLKPASGATTVKIDPEFGYGLSAGVDFAISPKLGIMGGLRWLNVQAQPDGNATALDVNPLFARVGLAAKF